MRISRALVILVLLSSALALAPAVVQAQFENNTWYFGYGDGLDFSTSPPTVLADGALDSFEGSASISDPTTGELLFYTDGMTIFNRAHVSMPNGTGIASDWSSTQPAVIVPVPGDPTRYYLFTADQSGYRGAPRGINYTIVDMDGDNGFGDVVVKNSPLLALASEKITAVKICNGDAYWIISHEFYGKKFYAWRVDAEGISAPVISEVGSYHGPSQGDGVGWMSASPDGTMLALAFFDRGQNTIELFKFDAMEGKVSDAIIFGAGPVQPYGITFSPQSKKLYATSIGHIDQYDVQVWSGFAIAESYERLESVTQENGAIKIGRDGKLYIQHSGYIGTISQPELDGLQCQYDERAIMMGGGTRYGLPNNIDAQAAGYCGPPETHIRSFVSPICEDECVSFFDSSRFGATSWLWEFEGAQPPTSTQKDPKNICYPLAGTYKIKLTARNAAGSTTDTKNITVQQCLPPQVSLKDTAICAMNCITFVDTSSADHTRTWQFPGGTPSAFTGNTPPPVCFDKPGSYQVKLIASNAWGRDTAQATVTVNDCPWPVARSEYDTVVCIGTRVMFTDRSSNSPHAWEWTFEGGSPASASSKDAGPIVYDIPGLYAVQQIVHNANGVDTAITQIHVTRCDPPVALLSDHDLCQSECIDLADQSDNAPTSWLWTLSGPMQKTYTVKTPGQLCFDDAGTYQMKLVVANDYGQDSATSTITVRSAAGWATPSIAVVSPIALCSVVDTFITVYSGCAPFDVTNISSSDPSVTIANAAISLNANDSARIQVRIAPTQIGAMNAAISVMLGSVQQSIQMAYTGSADSERFIFGDLDGDLATLACEPVDHSMTITNDACADHAIVYIGFEPPNPAFKIVLQSLDFLIKSKGTMQLGVQYDASVAEDTQTELVIRTAGGIEKRFALTGSRLLPASGALRFDAMGPTSTMPNEPMAAVLSFDQSIESHLAPEVIEMSLRYNTDLISASNIIGKDGWTVLSQIEGVDRLDLRLTRTKGAIAANAQLVEIQFNSFVTSESTTELWLERLVCNPGDSDYVRCVYDLKSLDSSRATILPICGSTEFQSKLAGVQAIQVVINPHPVRAGEALAFAITAGLPALIGQPLSVQLIDLAGRESDLFMGVLRSAEQNFSLPLGGVASGVYVLQVQIGDEIKTTTLVIR